MDDHLDKVLGAAGVEGDQLDATDLTAMWATLGIDDSLLLDEFVYAAASLSRASGGTTDAALGFRLGRWKLDLARMGVRAGLTAAVVAGAITADGLTTLGVGLVAIVVPEVLDIEDVSLDPGDQKLLLVLRLKPEVQQQFLTDDQLYDSLPDDAKQVVNRFDFADFVGRLRQAGSAQELVGLTRVRRPDERRPLISWR